MFECQGESCIPPLHPLHLRRYPSPARTRKHRTYPPSTGCSCPVDRGSYPPSSLSTVPTVDPGGRCSCRGRTSSFERAVARRVESSLRTTVPSERPSIPREGRNSRGLHG